MGIKLLKLLKTPLKVSFLYTEVVNLLFSRHSTTSRNEKVLLCLCFTLLCSFLLCYGESERHLFVRASEHLGMTPLTGKRLKNPKKSAIFHDIFLKDHDVSFEDFLILLKENSKFSYT